MIKRLTINIIISVSILYVVKGMKSTVNRSKKENSTDEEYNKKDKAALKIGTRQLQLILALESAAASTQKHTQQMLSDMSYDDYGPAADLLDQIKHEKHRPDVEHFRVTIGKVACPDERARLFKRTYNIIGTVFHKMVAAGLDDLVKCALGFVDPKDRLSILMLPTASGITVFHYSAWCGQTESMGILLNAVDDTRQRVSLLKKTDACGYTALYYAVTRGFPKVVDAILSKTPSETVSDLVHIQVNKRKQNIYDIAVQHGQDKVIAVLQQHLDKPNPQSRIQDGRASPVVVERAETTQNLEMVEIMRRLTEQSLWYQQAMLGKMDLILKRMDRLEMNAGRSELNGLKAGFDGLMNLQGFEQVRDLESTRNSDLSHADDCHVRPLPSIRLPGRLTPSSLRGPSTPDNQTGSLSLELDELSDVSRPANRSTLDQVYSVQDQSDGTKKGQQA